MSRRQTSFPFGLNLTLWRLSPQPLLLSPRAALQVMANAFEDVCRELGLAQTEDPLRDLVAEVIIKCVQDGERDEDRIRECARNALKN
jgi:hypothetical protein